MRILVTGATGFIGRRLVRALATEHRVVGVARTQPADPVEGVEWISCDLSQASAVEALPERIDIVAHLAQSRHYRAFPERALDIFQVNAASTAALLDYARSARAQTFLFASTGGISGYKPDPIGEEDAPQPNSYYVTSKLIAEQLIQSYREHFTTVVLRYFFVYGPGQRGMLVPTLFERVRTGTPVVLFGPDGIEINPIFVDDAVAATVAALGLDGHETINIAGKEVVSIRALADLIGELAGTSPRYEQSSALASNLVAKTDRMRVKLGVTPAVPLRAGLARVASGT
jgi:nucleoside-diphosphate-sugar epimerase